MENKVYYGEYSLEHWKELILKKNIILPGYQRYFVWDAQKAKKLIESFEKNEFVPPVTIGSYVTSEGRENLILDGQQRLTSILLSYLGIFPNKEKYKKVVQTLADDNDTELDDDEYDNVLEWSLNYLTDKGSNKEKILSEIEISTYDEIPSVDDKFMRNHYLGFSYLVPQKDSGRADIEFYSEQQNFYSSVFRNINIQGEPLLPQESRKSLYFLKDTLVDFFEPKFSNLVFVNDSKMDFVRYIAILSHYRKVGRITKVGYGYARRMENLYEKFIYAVANDENQNLFEQLPKEIIEGDYKIILDEIESTIEQLFPERRFKSIIDLDVNFFGLFEYMIFQQRKIDISKKSNLIQELQNTILKFKEDNNHTKNPAALKHLRNRMEKSIDIYGKYTL